MFPNYKKILQLEDLRRRAYLTQKQLVYVCGFSAVSNYSRMINKTRRNQWREANPEILMRFYVGTKTLKNGFSYKVLPLRYRNGELCYNKEKGEWVNDRVIERLKIIFDELWEKTKNED